VSRIGECLSLLVVSFFVSCVLTGAVLAGAQTALKNRFEPCVNQDLLSENPILALCRSAIWKPLV
jgi:hypothetical protein